MKTKALIFGFIFAAAGASAKEAEPLKGVGHFVCVVVSAGTLESNLKHDCDVTKPFSANGSGDNAMYCCTTGEKYDAQTAGENRDPRFR